MAKFAAGLITFVASALALNFWAESLGDISVGNVTSGEWAITALIFGGMAFGAILMIRSV